MKNLEGYSLDFYKNFKDQIKNYLINDSNFEIKDKNEINDVLDKFEFQYDELIYNKDVFAFFDWYFHIEGDDFKEAIESGNTSFSTIVNFYYFKLQDELIPKLINELKEITSEINEKSKNNINSQKLSQ